MCPYDDINAVFDDKQQFVLKKRIVKLLNINPMYNISASIKKIVFVACVVCVAQGLTSCYKTSIQVVPVPGVATPPPVHISNWTRLNSLGDTITVLAGFNHVIYAASNHNTLYTSSNGGETWTSVRIGTPDITITAIQVFNDQIYVGTDNNGIFSSADAGRTWSNYVDGFQAYNIYGYLVGYPVSSFAVKDNILYVSTMGNGVYVLNQATNRWSAFNNNLPQIITSYNVFKILNTNTTLVAAGGINGTFYYYDFANNQWMETLLPHWGTYVNKMIIDNEVLYAITTEQKMIRSDNNGVNWDYDTADLHVSSILNYRELCAGTTKDYVLTVQFSNTAESGTYIQQRDKNVAIGTSWATGQQFLNGIHAHAILESDGRLFLGANEGLYVKNI